MCIIKNEEVQPYPCEGSVCAPIAEIHKFQKRYISVVCAVCVGCTKYVMWVRSS